MQLTSNCVMNIVMVVLFGVSIVTTVTAVILGSMLSRCNTSYSYDDVKGGKTETEKEEYGLVILDEGECNCGTGLGSMKWTILEIMVIGVLLVVTILMVIKGALMGVGFLKEKKQERLTEKQRQEDLTRERIRMEERDRFANVTMETN